MALTVSDRIKETTTTTGTGTYTLGGAVTGFETFTANLSNSDTTYYACSDGTDFEVGLGTFTSSGTTLARTTILASSNSNNAVSWSSGTRTIFCTLPAAKTVFLDASGNATLGADLSVGDDLTVNGGVIDVKNAGAQSVVRFYCESSNAHYTEIKAAPHSTYSGNATLVLPSSDDTIVGRATTDTLTNKTLTSPVLNTGVSGTAILDEDNMASNSATQLATQQSIKAYVDSETGSIAADDISTGDAAINIATTSGNITIDAQGSNTDIIFKGTDGGVDITAFTLDMSSAGRADFNNGVTSPSYFWQKTDGGVNLYAGANFEVALTHVHNTGFKLTNAGTGTPAVELQFVDSNESISSDGTNLKLKSGGNAITVPNTAGTMALTSNIPSSGISSGNVATFTSGVVDNDFLRVDGTNVEGRSASQVLSDIGATSATDAANEATALAIALG